jgi:hypothetical protein
VWQEVAWLAAWPQAWHNAVLLKLSGCECDLLQDRSGPGNVFVSKCVVRALLGGRPPGDSRAEARPLGVVQGLGDAGAGVEVGRWWGAHGTVPKGR